MPANSVDMVLTDLPKRFPPPSDEVVRLYTQERWTLRRIADLYHSNHHVIRRILHKNNVEIIGNRARKPVSDETRKRQSAAAKKRGPHLTKYTYSEAQNRANQKRKMGTVIDLDQYKDFERLKFLTKLTSRYRKHFGHSDEVRKAFIDKFWNDPAFNAIYDRWISSGQNKWWMPSLDHKQPKSRKGSWALDNLEMLTWFENRAKDNMTSEEWAAFKRTNHISSDLFIENILNDRIQPNGEQHREDSGLSTPLRRCA
ncbi:HNH endonuclease signature motif containing protein [Granulicella mallensis]|uniref:HNH endonuclease signature motif containing protein n=1 Tax=Granulicella mallensis TaxID=940614 RepID=UPI00167FB6E3|nr:HNH endonuclease signature motif containing protein [Granulicella mallensis]